MKLSELLHKIDELNEQIHSHGKLSPDILKRIDYKFRLDWNYNSNVMEGNSLTRAETRSVMVNNVIINEKPYKDISEMRGHDKVITDILKIGKGELNLSEKRIKDIHKEIMYEEDTKKKKFIGQWKTSNNHLLNYKNEKFDFTPYTEVPEKMHELLNWLNTEKDKIKNNSKDAIQPALLAFEFQLRYVTIHPFYDGNGRTARIFSNLILISYGYPPVIIKIEEKETYYRYLADIQAYGGSSELFYEFMCNLLINSQELVLKAINGESIEEADDVDKEITLLKRELSGKDILEHSKTSKLITEAIKKNITPLFILLEAKFDDLKDFFFEEQHRMYYKLEGSDHRHDISHNTWERIYELIDEILSEDYSIAHLHYSYELKGFKKKVNANNIALIIDTYFNDFNYNVIINNDYNQSIPLPYGKTLNKQELLELISPPIKILIDQIRKLNKN